MDTRIIATSRRWATLLLVAGMGVVGSAFATLLDRGPGMVYDDVLNITWVRDASLCVSLNNCVNRDDTTVTGGMSWDDTNTWAATLAYGGFDDWRLPYASVSAGVGPITTLTWGQPCTGLPAGEAACRENELAYMFYYNLGLEYGHGETGTLTAIGGEVLTGIQVAYWSGTEFNSSDAWISPFHNGFQVHDNKSYGLSAWAVRDGDVIPEPTTLALLGLGLAGLGLSRRKP